MKRGTWNDYVNELTNIKQLCEKTNMDWLVMVIGDEGSGKTTFSLRSAQVVDKKFDIKKQLVYNLEDFSNLTLDFMGEKKEEVQKLRSIVWDEAVDALFSRNYSSPVQKDLVRLYIKNRSLQHFTFINIPSPWYVDLYLRAHRTKAIAYCWLDRDNLSRRYVSLYYRNSFKDFLRSRLEAEYLMLDRPEFLKRYPPAVTFEFKSLEGTQTWEDYEEMKYADQRKTIEKIRDNSRLRRKSEETEVTKYMPMANFMPWLVCNFPAKDKMGRDREGYLYFSYELLAGAGYTSKSSITYLINKAINEGLITSIGKREYQILDRGKKYIINKD